MNNQNNVSTARVPRFLLGKPRTQWKGVMVRRDEIGTEGVRVITLDDVLGGASNYRLVA